MTQYLDSDGYPTEEALQFIREYDLFHKPTNDLIDFIESIWWMPDWGFIRKRPVKGTYTLWLHTGGWSGNESIMDAVYENKWFYTFFWRQSNAGGHFKFAIRPIDLEAIKKAEEKSNQEFTDKIITA